MYLLTECPLHCNACILDASGTPFCTTTTDCDSTYGKIDSNGQCECKKVIYDNTVEGMSASTMDAY